MIETFALDDARFNNPEFVDARLHVVPESTRGALKTALTYLYIDTGPTNLPRSRLLAAEPWLEPAERIAIRWMYTRTNGRLRKSYGADALRAAREARFRCSACGFTDVRVLNIDHVEGKVADTAFACLCANCHAIKSRQNDWLGLASTAAQACPLCLRMVVPNARYPRYVCEECATQASSLDGRPLAFGNEGLSGGLVAIHVDDGSVYTNRECWIRGVQCIVDESHFGGIVIQPA